MLINWGYITNLNTEAIQPVSFSGASGYAQFLCIFVIWPTHHRTIYSYLFIRSSNGCGPRIVRRKALADELLTDSIRFSCKITAIDTQEHEGSSSIAVVHLQDGSVIKAMVVLA